MAINLDDPGRWQLLKEELGRRLEEPRHYPTFVIYFIFVIVVLAGIGWIIPLIMAWYYGVGEKYEMLTPYFQSLSTYAIALSATSFVDLIISINEPQVSKRPFRNTFSLVIMFAFVVVVGLSLWTFSGMSMLSSATLAIIGTLLSWVVWWVCNGDNAKNLEEPPAPPNAALGGDPLVTIGDPNALAGGLNQ